MYYCAEDLTSDVQPRGDLPGVYRVGAGPECAVRWTYLLLHRMQVSPSTPPGGSTIRWGSSCWLFAFRGPGSLSLADLLPELGDGDPGPMALMLSAS